MGLLKKNKPAQIIGHDTASIDAAMSELTKQTEALLGHFGESKTDQKQFQKPNLPKKQTRPATKGKSFDIIHDPKRKTQLKATLKAVQARPPKSVINEPGVPLLPDHAGKSFNEVIPTKETTLDPADGSVRSETPSIILHEGRLSIGTPELAQIPEPIKPAVDPVQPSANESLRFNDNPTEESLETTKEQVDVQNSEQIEAPVEATQQPLPKAEISKNTPEPQSVDDSAYTSGELYANNLVKESKPRGYQLPEDKDPSVPAVFDTVDYHPELHDWSKLENKSSAKWLLLLLLVVVAGAATYFLVIGQKLPF